MKHFMLMCAALLSMNLAGTLLPEPVFAEETESAYEGLTYESADGAVTVTGYTDAVPAELVIPAEIGGLPVTAIGEKAFQNCLAITEVSLPDSITEIGNAAFRFCGSLKKAVLPDTLTVLPESLFAECSNLETVTIPAETECIRDSVFAKCEKLAELRIPESVREFGEDAFGGTAWLTAQREKNPFVIVNRILIDGKTCAGDITIPAEADYIGAGAFAYNQKVLSVVLPENVKGIARFGFYYCPALKSVTILNPQCDIFDLNSTISTSWAQHTAGLEGAVIRGYANSTAEAFAANRNFSFALIYDPETLAEDYNCDGSVTVADAVLLARYLSVDPAA